LPFNTTDSESTARVKHLVTVHLVRWHYYTLQMASRWTKHTVGGGKCHIRNRWAKRRRAVNFRPRPLDPWYCILGLDVDIVVIQKISCPCRELCISQPASHYIDWVIRAIESRLISWRWRQQVHLKRLKLSNRHGVTFQKTITFIVTALRKSNLTSNVFILVQFISKFPDEERVL
jgi:hypothetical protein